MNEFLSQSLDLGHHHVTVLQVLEALAVLVLARIGLAVARRGLARAAAKAMDAAKTFILGRLLTSVVWAVATMLALSTLGVDLTALWAGSAALLVGVGIGLQGFFNDVVSGFVLLFEGGVAVGNVLEVDGELVRVERIDLRSTRVVTVTGELIVLPNSKVAGEAVINLSQGDSAMRIRVDVGVAYGSDVELVMRLLSEAMAAQPEVLTTPSPAVFSGLCRFVAAFQRHGLVGRPVGPHGHSKPGAHGHR